MKNGKIMLSYQCIYVMKSDIVQYLINFWCPKDQAQ